MNFTPMPLRTPRRLWKMEIGRRKDSYLVLVGSACHSNKHLLKSLRVIGPAVRGVSKWIIGTDP